MEVFQDLKLFVPPAKEQIFIEKLIDKISQSKWKHKIDFEENYKNSTSSSDSIILCTESYNFNYSNKTLNAFVWLRKYKDFFEIFNIVPSKSGSLTYSEYNFILNVFYKDLLEDIISELNIRVEFSKPEKSIVDLIGEDASDALIDFSRGANKSTGNSNPHDFNRWCDFVFIVYRNSIAISIDDFVRWLVEEENWSDDIAWRLGSDLEYALEILKRYEQN